MMSSSGVHGKDSGMEFRVPQLGEGVYEAEVVRWRVTVGQTVQPGQTLLEMMTDKATMDVPAPFHGTIVRLVIEPGMRVAIGSVMLEFTPAVSESPGDRAVALLTSEASMVVPDESYSSPTAHRPPAIAAPSVRHLARQLGVDLSMVTGSGPGGRILLDDVNRRHTTTKATMVVPDESSLRWASVGSQSHEMKTPPTHGIDIPRSPKTMPTPPGHRVDDLPLMNTTTISGRSSGPALNLGQPGTRIPLLGLRRQIAEYLTEVSRRVPQCSLIDECDLTDAVRLRNTLKDPLQSQGVKLTYLPFFVLACVRALKEVPLFNSSLDETRNEIVLHDRYHIGIAVAVPDGVLVPVLRDADQMDLITIAREIDRITRAARSGTSTREDLQGGTFTVTSIGGIGGLIATPMVPHPQAAILGIGKIIPRPVYIDDQLRRAEMAYLSLSFDHRILDGAIAAIFVNAVMRQLQHPARLLLPADLRESIAIPTTAPRRKSA